MMKQGRLIILLWMCILHTSLFAKENVSPRETINFNCDWKYLRGDCQGAEQAGYNDSKWEQIGLPHSFSIPYFMSKDFYTGYGWYRKNFTLGAADLRQKLFLEFDGVFQEAEVYVNGKKIGSHVGGYTGFSLDMSAAVRTGHNVIAVRVNNLWKSNVAPRAGEHVFSGGIYRNVRLVKKAPLHIDWYGTFISTPGLIRNNGKATAVNVRTDVCNSTGSAVEYELVTQVKDAGGTVVASAKSKETIAPNSTKTCEQNTTNITAPHLWHPRMPYLYKVISLLYQDNKLVDSTETATGFRWLEWTADKGFFLNGEHYLLQGVNVHQDQAGWGDAITESAMRRDVRMMKEAGFNLIRGSHYPHAPFFSQACDEEGMMFWSEAPFWGIGGFKADGHWDSSAYPVNDKDIAGFEASALAQLGEMIRIHRNHPSIVVWSMSNEAFFSAPETMDGVCSLLKKMVDLSHRLDPTRLAAVGGAQRPLGTDRIDKIGDVAGYNGDGATQPDFQNPGIPSVVSEYGSVTADRPGEYAPGWGDLARNDGWQGYPWRSGQAIWCGFDHGSIAGSDLGKMGIVDYFRIPKRAWYWYRNEYSKIAPPAWPKAGTAAKLKLQASQTQSVRTDGTDDVQLTVSVLDAAGRPLNNSPEVQLRLVSGPGEFPTGTSICFNANSDIRILDGQAAIAFRSYYAGTAVIEATSPGLLPARISIAFIGNRSYKKGVTPQVKERPYTRFTREKQSESVRTFGRNNPTFASSSAQSKAVGLAADGNRTTYWQATKEDKSPYWMLDTEKGLVLHEISILFPPSVSCRYVVEVSDNKEQWTLVSDQWNKAGEQPEVTLDLKTRQLKARFVRVRFSDESDAAIAEMIVKGVVRQ